MHKTSITFVGAGNVATHLSLALAAAGFVVRQVWSRTETSAEILAGKLGCPFTTNLLDVNLDSDVYIISVKDDVLEQIASTLLGGRDHALFLHTAGSMPMDVLKSGRRGVLYPMQTFSKDKSVAFAEVPFFIETSVDDDLELVKTIATSLSQKVYVLKSEDRKYLHLAAVFCCNFANHCSALAARLLADHGIPFDVMLPLVDETAAKLHVLSPSEAQTGPAVRGDEVVMNRHLDILKADGEDTLSSIYKLLSDSISSNKRND